MTDETNIKSPIEVKNSSQEQTAFDLMNLIALEEKSIDSDSKDRKYWLTLYSQCLNATSGYGLESILKEE